MTTRYIATMALLGATTAGPSSDWTKEEEPTWGDIIQDHRDYNAE